jgi:hypothetical protein
MKWTLTELATLPRLCRIPVSLCFAALQGRELYFVIFVEVSDFAI